MVVAGLTAMLAFGMFSLPYFLRTNSVATSVLFVTCSLALNHSICVILQENLVHKEGKLSGSSRQRGMFMNAGSIDVGRDPDWDPVTNTYKGRKSMRHLSDDPAKSDDN
jgi:hypothetical protein